MSELRNAEDSARQTYLAHPFVPLYEGSDDARCFWFDSDRIDPPSCGHPAIHSVHSAPLAYTDDQPAPVVNDRPAIQDLVMADVAERKREGTEKYGTPLQAFNGRDALADAYQEALDLCQYLRQALYERDGR